MSRRRPALPAVLVALAAAATAAAALPSGPPTTQYALTTPAAGTLPVHGTVIEQIPNAAGTTNTYPTAVAASGGLLVVGTAAEDSGAGAAHVYNASATGWHPLATLQIGDLPTGAGFGRQVAITPDARIAISAPAAGEVYIYTPHGSTWTLDGHVHAPAGESATFGAALALTGDLLAVGAPGDSRTPGVVNLYTRDSAGWHSAAALHSDYPAPGDGFGAALTTAGGTLAIGAPGQTAPTSGSGAVHTYTTTAPWHPTGTLRPLDAVPGAHFGASLAGEAGTLVAGAPGAFGTRPGIRTGAGYVFTFTAQDGWSQTVKLASGATAPAFAGASVALSSTTVVVGAPAATSDGAGGGDVYVRSAGTWAKSTTISSPMPTPGLGALVAVAQDRTVLVADIGS